MHVVQTPSENAPDQFELDIGGVKRKLFIYDVTQDRFYFHANFPTGTTVTSGVYNSGALHLGGAQLTQTNANAPVVHTTVKIPVRNLEGTWTSTGENPMVVTNGENPFEYHFSIAAVNPGAVSYTHLTLPTKA